MSQQELLLTVLGVGGDCIHASCPQCRRRIERWRQPCGNCGLFVAADCAEFRYALGIKTLLADEVTWITLYGDGLSALMGGSPLAFVRAVHGNAEPELSYGQSVRSIVESCLVGMVLQCRGHWLRGRSTTTAAAGGSSRHFVAKSVQRGDGHRVMHVLDVISGKIGHAAAPLTVGPQAVTPCPASAECEDNAMYASHLDGGIITPVSCLKPHRVCASTETPASLGDCRAGNPGQFSASSFLTCHQPSRRHGELDVCGTTRSPLAPSGRRRSRKLASQSAAMCTPTTGGWADLSLRTVNGMASCRGSSARRPAPLSGLCSPSGSYIRSWDQSLHAMSKICAGSRVRSNPRQFTRPRSAFQGTDWSNSSLIGNSATPRGPCAGVPLLHGWQGVLGASMTGARVSPSSPGTAHDSSTTVCEAADVSDSATCCVDFDKENLSGECRTPWSRAVDLSDRSALPLSGQGPLGVCSTAVRRGVRRPDFCLTPISRAADAASDASPSAFVSFTGSQDLFESPGPRVHASVASSCAVPASEAGTDSVCMGGELEEHSKHSPDLSVATEHASSATLCCDGMQSPVLFSDPDFSRCAGDMWTATSIEDPLGDDSSLCRKLFDVS